MAIDRGPWNALVDDDGSNLIGTVWNKDQIKTVILDPVDAAILANVPPPAFATVITNTQTGTIHDWAPAGLSGNTIIRWNGATSLAVTGLVAGAGGQTVTIYNESAANVVTFAHGNTGSVIANRFRCIATSAPTPIATGGWATFYYDALLALWVLVAHEQGAWIQPPFNAANFPAPWSVAAGNFYLSYILRGRQLAIKVELLNTTITANTPEVKILNGAYGGFTVPYGAQGLCTLDNAGGAIISTGNWYGGNLFGFPSQVLVRRIDLQNIVATTGAFAVHGLITLDVT